MNKSILLSLLIVYALLCVGCSKESQSDAFEKFSEEICGEYVLTEIHWSGSAVDLDGDGDAYWDIRGEFGNINGYFEPMNRCSVEESGQSSFYINCLLPYPDFRLVSGEYRLNGISYQPVTLHEEYWYENIPTASIGRFQVSDDALVFLKSIENIELTEFNDGKVVVRVYCQMFDCSGQTSDKNYMHYTFTRK